MEREVGGVIGIGNTCKSMADSFQCMTKPTIIKKNHVADSKLQGTVDHHIQRANSDKERDDVVSLVCGISKLTRSNSMGRQNQPHSLGQPNQFF